MAILKISLYVSTGWYVFIWLVSVSDGAIFPLIFYSYVGNCVGAALAYLVLIGISGDVDIEVDEEKGIVMAACSLLFMFAFPLFIYGGFSDFSDSGVMGVMRAIRFSYILPLLLLVYVLIGGLGGLALALTSPVWGILALVGMVKLIIYWKNRPAAIDAVKTGEVFDLDTIMTDLKAKMTAAPTGPFAKWENKTRTYWANKIAEQYEAGTRAARATNEAYKAARVRKEMNDE